MQPPLRFAPKETEGVVLGKVYVCKSCQTFTLDKKNKEVLALLQLICSPKRWNLLFHKIWQVTVLFFSAENNFFTNLKMHSRFGTKLLNQKRSYLVFCSIVQIFFYLQSCLLSIQVVFNVSFLISWQTAVTR